MPEFRRFMPPLLGKSLVIGGLILLLLVPIANVESLVGERVGMRQEAADRVAASWGGAQTTAGVLLAIPVETTRVVIEQSAAGRESQRKEVQRNVLYVLPDTLNVTADVKPYYRSVGLYQTPVYEARVNIAGSFLGRDFAHLLQAREGREVLWSEARLLVLNSESRALRGVDDLWVAERSRGRAAAAYAGSRRASRFCAALRERVGHTLPAQTHARGQQPARHLPAAGAQGLDRTGLHLAGSEVHGCAGTARVADQRKGIPRALVGTGDQSQFRPELVRLLRERRPAGAGGIRGERCGCDVLSPWTCTSATTGRCTTPRCLS